MKKIGIVVAMDEEFEAVENKMKDIQTKQIYNLRFTIGKIGKKECILVKSGVGKVHSARTTQVLIDNFDLEFIVNVGAAGSVNDMLQIGDVVIGKEVVQHDFDITAFGHSKGYITGVGNSIKCDEKLVEKLKFLDIEVIDVVNDAIKELKNDNQEIKLKINQLENKKESKKYQTETAKFILNIINNCFDVYDSLTLKDKKDILNMFVEEATVTNRNTVWH